MNLVVTDQNAYVTDHRGDKRVDVSFEEMTADQRNRALRYLVQRYQGAVIWRGKAIQMDFYAWANKSRNTPKTVRPAHTETPVDIQN